MVWKCFRADDTRALLQKNEFLFRLKNRKEAAQKNLQIFLVFSTFWSTIFAPKCTKASAKQQQQHFPIDRVHQVYSLT